MLGFRKQHFAWAFYDWANSAFATTVLAGFFPLFFAQYWASDLAPGDRTFWLGVAGTVSSLIVMVLAPALGGLADQRGHKKRYLLISTIVGVLATAGLWAVGKGQWPLALGLFTLGSVGFFAGISFYDSTIVEVAEPAELDRVSGLGYGLGYLGGGLLFAVNAFMAMKPELFGLPDAGVAVRVSFLMVAVWWALFTIPIMIGTQETANPKARGGFGELKETFRKLLQPTGIAGTPVPGGVAHKPGLGGYLAARPILTFLIGYWLYIDGVDTLIRMAVDYGDKMGLPAAAMIQALLLVQFVGFPAAIVFGKLAETAGAKPMLYAGLTVYALATLGAFFITEKWHFFAMAAAIGCVQGGVQALSRSYYAALIPAGEAGQYFGFYNMLGKFAAVLGPLAMGAVAYFVADQRFSVLALLPFFVVGGLILSRVPTPTAEQARASAAA